MSKKDKIPEIYSDKLNKPYVSKHKPKGYVFGRPTKYKEEYCDMLIDHMAEGLSFESFGKVVFAGRTTLYRWVDDNKDFRDAKEIATQFSHHKWDEIGVRGTQGKIPFFNSHSYSKLIECKFPENYHLENVNLNKNEHSGSVEVKKRLLDDD